MLIGSRLVATALASAFMIAPASAVEAPARPNDQIIFVSGKDVRGVAKEPLNLRNGPGKQYRKLGELPKGSELIYLSPPGCMNGYCFVQGRNGARGWVLNEFVLRMVGQNTGKGAKSDFVGYGVSRDDLYLRAGPDKSTANLGIVRKGTVMNLVRSPPCRNGYCLIETPSGSRGWVLRERVSMHGF